MATNEQVNALKEARRAIMDVLEITTTGEKTISCIRLRAILCPPYEAICEAISHTES